MPKKKKKQYGSLVFLWEYRHRDFAFSGVIWKDFKEKVRFEVDRESWAQFELPRVQEGILR